MELYKHLKELLQEKYDSGMTDKEIADEIGVSQQQINSLRKGRRSFEKMRLETLFRLFPDIQISLNGSPITANNSAVVAGDNNGSMTIHAATPSTQAMKDAAVSALLDSDMCPECIIKACKIIKGLQIS